MRTTAGWECRPVRFVATGDIQPCYTGTAVTLNVGECKAGVWRWDGSSFGPCTGEVTPITEVCGDGLDNDCSGTADDGC